MTSSQPPAPAASNPAKPAIVIISNEPTPYRLHVLNRIAHELPDVHVHNIFTHSLTDPSMPWKMQIDPTLNPVYFHGHHLVFGQPFSYQCVSLYRQIRDWASQHQIKLIVLLGYNDMARILLIRWAKRANIPLLLAADSNIHADDHTPPLKRAIKKRVVGWVLSNISGVMPMGSAGQKFFRRYSDHQLPEFLFPYEPDYDALRKLPDSEKEAFKQNFSLSPDRRRLLYCGRLIPIKRVNDLIAAFSQIASANPNWDLLILGDGPDRKNLESQVPSDLHNRVKFLGFLQFNQVIAAYHACDCLVHPAEFEPWGLVINEAVACDLPIISTPVVGAAIELVRDQMNGLIVPPRDIPALTNALNQITNPDRLAQMRSQCAQVLEAWRKTADPVDGLRKALRHFQII